MAPNTQIFERKIQNMLPRGDFRISVGFFFTGDVWLQFFGILLSNLVLKWSGFHFPNWGFLSENLPLCYRLYATWYCLCPYQFARFLNPAYYVLLYYCTNFSHSRSAASFSSLLTICGTPYYWSWLHHPVYFSISCKKVFQPAILIWIVCASCFPHTLALK